MGDELYILMSKGRVQLWTQQGKKGMLVAGSYEAAKRIRDNLAKQKKCSIAKLGTIEGETLDVQFDAAKEEGATGVWFSRDGEHLQWATRRG